MGQFLAHPHRSGLTLAAQAGRFDTVESGACRAPACADGTGRGLTRSRTREARAKGIGRLDSTTFRLYYDFVGSAEVIRKLKAAGWKHVRTKGSHQHFSQPNRRGLVVTVPHPKKDLSIGLVKAIERQSGVKLLP